MGPSNYGLLTFAGSIVPIFRSLAACGLEHVVVRDLVRNPKKRHEILGSALALSFITSIALYGILWLSLPRIAHLQGSHVLLLVIGLTIPLESLRVFDQDFLACEKARLGAKARTVGIIVAILSRALFVMSKLPVLAFGWVMVIQRGLGSLSSILVSRQTTGLRLATLSPKWKPALKLITSARFLLLESFALMVFIRMDQYMLATMMDIREVGFLELPLGSQRFSISSQPIWPPHYFQQLSD